MPKPPIDRPRTAAHGGLFPGGVRNRYIIFGPKVTPVASNDAEAKCKHSSLFRTLFESARPCGIMHKCIQSDMCSIWALALIVNSFTECGKTYADRTNDQLGVGKM